MPSNDEVRHMLLQGCHQEDGWQAVFESLAHVDLCTVFVGDPMGNPQPWPMDIQPGMPVLPVFTHEELLRGNLPLPSLAWVDEIGIRQAATIALNRGWSGVYVNFRANGWLLDGDLLRAASLGHLPAA